MKVSHIKLAIESFFYNTDDVEVIAGICRSYLIIRTAQEIFPGHLWQQSQIHKIRQWSTQVYASASEIKLYHHHTKDNHPKYNQCNFTWQINWFFLSNRRNLKKKNLCKFWEVRHNFKILIFWQLLVTKKCFFANYISNIWVLVFERFLT